MNGVYYILCASTTLSRSDRPRQSPRQSPFGKSSMLWTTCTMGGFGRKMASSIRKILATTRRCCGIQRDARVFASMKHTLFGYQRTDWRMRVRASRQRGHFFFKTTMS